MNVYINYLPLNISDDALAAKFSPHGDVVMVRIMRHLSTGQSKGYGFVLMKHEPEARSAIAALNGTTWHDKRLLVKPADKAANPTTKPAQKVLRTARHAGDSSGSGSNSSSSGNGHGRKGSAGGHNSDQRDVAPPPNAGGHPHAVGPPPPPGVLHHPALTLHHHYAMPPPPHHHHYMIGAPPVPAPHMGYGWPPIGYTHHPAYAALGPLHGMSGVAQGTGPQQGAHDPFAPQQGQPAHAISETRQERTAPHMAPAEVFSAAVGPARHGVPDETRQRWFE